MFKVGVFYENRLGRNDGNPLYIMSALRRMAHFTDVANKRPQNEHHFSGFPDAFKKGAVDPLAEAAAQEFMRHDPEGLKVSHVIPTGDIKPYGKFDLNVWVDWGEDGLKGILPYEPIECPRPMAYWASDTHIQTPDADSYTYRLSMARKADFVFCAQKRGLEQMKADGIETPIWLPHAVEPLAYPKFTFASKKYDVCFVGHINSGNRVEALDRLFSEFPNFFYGQRLFEQAAEVYGQSKIVFNISMTDDINMRTFEGMATGSMMLTSWIPTIEELFEDGKHLVLYRSLDEMVDKAKYYLAHDSEREKIAAAGYEEVMKKHTIQHRLNTILETAIKSRLVAA